MITQGEQQPSPAWAENPATGNEQPATEPQSPRDTISDMYRNILGREPDQAGLDFWTNAVTSGDTTYDGVRQTFSSGEQQQPGSPDLSGGQSNIDLQANQWTPTTQNNDYSYTPEAAQAGQVTAGSYQGPQAGYQTYDPVTGQAQGYEATTGTATGYNAGLLGGAADYDAILADASKYSAYSTPVQNNDLVSHQLNQLISQDSPYMNLARQSGMQYANSRGLLNSSIGGAASQEAAIRAALPIAQGDASTYDRRALADMQYQNQALSQNAQMQQQTNLFNAGEQNLASRFAGENARFDVTQGNDALRFNAGAQNQFGIANMNAVNQANQFNAGAQNQFGIANMNAVNQANQFNAGAYNTNQIQNAQLQQQSLSDNAHLAQQASITQANLDSNANQFNAGQSNQASQFGQDRAFGADQFNAGQENLAGRDFANNQDQMDRFSEQLNEDSRQFDATLDFDKWATEFIADKDLTLREMDRDHDFNLLSEQARINMKADYIDRYDGILNDAQNQIHDIQMSTNITPEDKSVMIQNIIDTAATRRDSLNIVFSEISEWDGALDFLEADVPETGQQGLLAGADEPQAIADPTSDIASLYATVLNRNPDQAGLDWYKEQIQSGAMTIDDVKQDMESNKESDASSPETQLHELFQSYLGRAPDQSALDYYLPIIKNDGLAKVEEDIMGSREVGIVKDIQKLYKDILGRDADDAGLRFWTTAIMEGTATIEDVREAFEKGERAA